jgi:hypothetical protein
MIKIVAIKTLIAKISCTSKTLVNVFQLIYVVAALVIIIYVDALPQSLFYICSIALFSLFLFRLLLKWFPKVCGECNEVLEESNGIECSECGCYNVYDLGLWTKLKFDNAKAAHSAEISRFVQNIIALTVVLFLFSSPLLYFIFVIDKDIHQLNQQRQIAFVQIRPAFLKYKEKHGKFPASLEKLKPDYITQIPSVLTNANKGRYGNLRISYQTDEETATFIFHVSHAPIPVMSYDIKKNLYTNDSKISEFFYRL